jgi:hypothetical protein
MNMVIMHNKRKIVLTGSIVLLLIICGLYYMNYLKADDSNKKPSMEIENNGSISAKLSLVASPYVIGNSFLTEKEIKEIDGTNINFSATNITFAGINCNVSKDQITRDSFEYITSNYKVLRDPNNQESSASRSLLPQEVGITSANILVKSAQCNGGDISIINEIENKKIIIEYKNSFFGVVN